MLIGKIRILGYWNERGWKQKVPLVQKDGLDDDDEVVSVVVDDDEYS